MIRSMLLIEISLRTQARDRRLDELVYTLPSDDSFVDTFEAAFRSAARSLVT
jgi:hypothetical protein